MGAVRRLLHPVVLAQDLEDLPSADASQRIAIANNATVRRWTRVVTVGTFSSCLFAVTLVRNQTAVVF